MNIYLFEVELTKFNSSEVYEKVHVMAYSAFHCSHIVMNAIHDEDGEYDRVQLDIGSIRKMHEVTHILNPAFVLDMMNEEGDEDEEHNHYTGDIPLNIAKNLTDENTIEFSCECHEKLRVPAGLGFPFLTCNNCGLEIKPSEIKSAGGIYFYQKETPKKK